MSALSFFDDGVDALPEIAMPAVSVSAARLAIVLRPYQEAARAALLSPPEGVTRDLLVLATGCGKTISFADLISRTLGPGERALVIAHRDELLQQAKDKILMVDPTLTVEIEQGGMHASRRTWGSRRTVVVASVATLHARRLATWPKDAFKLIVCDEAHHATATSYLGVFRHFGAIDSPEGTTPTRLVGVTATPNRSDEVGLGAVFQRIAYTYTLRDAIDAGSLVPIRAWRASTGTDLSGVKVKRGDYDAKQLERAVDDDERNATAVAYYEAFAAGRKAVVFCAGVQHAHHMAATFRASGHTAEAVHGTLDKAERAAILARFASGATRVVCNMAVLIEGWDEPTTGCVILARPTKSALLLTQMVGRGTRLAPGKDDVVVIDLQDTTEALGCASVASLVGLPPKFDAKGRSVTAVAQEFEGLDPRLAPRALTPEDVERLKNEAVPVDLLAQPQAAAIKARSSLAWFALDRGFGETVYAIRVENDRYTIAGDTLGRFTVAVARGKDHATLFVVDDLGEAFRLADASIRDAHANQLNLISANARWRKDPATEAQLAALARRGIHTPPGLTKGDASALMDAAMASRGARRGRR